MKAGQVKVWLDQGPAVLLAECEIESQAVGLGEFSVKNPKKEKGWVIGLLQTGEILSVHEDTLHDSEKNKVLDI